MATAQSIIEFLNKKFPEKQYSIWELQVDFKVSLDTIHYCIEKFGVPTFKIGDSHFILRENLIDFLLRLKEEDDNRNRRGFRQGKPLAHG